jgi:hypothetical protein
MALPEPYKPRMLGPAAEGRRGTIACQDFPRLSITIDLYLSPHPEGPQLPSLFTVD